MLQSLRDTKFHPPVKKAIEIFLMEAGFTEEQTGIVTSANSSGLVIDIDADVIICRMSFLKGRWVFGTKIFGVDDEGSEIMHTHHSMETVLREHAMYWAKDMARTFNDLRNR